MLRGHCMTNRSELQAPRVVAWFSCGAASAIATVLAKIKYGERQIGHAINKDEKGPVYLDELAPNRGRFESDAPADCGFTCEVS